jgi:predicted MPP superfamily phosphohydrolase
VVNYVWCWKPFFSAFGALQIQHYPSLATYLTYECFVVFISDIFLLHYCYGIFINDVVDQKQKKKKAAGIYISIL